MSGDLKVSSDIHPEGSEFHLWVAGEASGWTWQESEAWEAAARALWAERNALRARADAAEAEVTRLRAEVAQARTDIEERPLGDHDARNVLWLAGGSIKKANITSPAGKAAYDRFEATPRVEVEGSFPRNGPERIDALVDLIRECHEIHSVWHDRLLSRAEAEAYVRGSLTAGGAR